MTDEQILQAFEGRWRIKSASPVLTTLNIKVFETVRDICLDFFKTGIILGYDNGKEIKIFDIEQMHLPTKQLDGQLITPFEYWWNLYDKKRGKEKCLKKWNQLTNDECVACLAATPAYVESTPDKKYRKDPLTYLNGKCWNDEIIPNNGTNKPTADEQRISKLAGILAP